MKRLNISLMALIVAVLSQSTAAIAAPTPLRWPASAGADGQGANAIQPSKKDVLARLKTLQEQQIASATELDAAIRKQLQETLTLEIKKDDLPVASRRTNLVTKKIDELNKRRDELNARREIVDRLIFQVDSKWSGQKLQEFLEQTFIEMASTDLADGRDAKLWKAFTYLSIVMREAPEPGEDVFAIFQGYLNYSSVLDPKAPGDYLASRNYTNGSESAVAHQSPRTSVGDGVTSPETPVVNPTGEVRTTVLQASANPENLKTETPKAQQQVVANAANSTADVKIVKSDSPSTNIVIGPTPAPHASAPPTPIKAARDREATNPPNTVSGTSQSARELTAPASESQLH